LKLKIEIGNIYSHPPLDNLFEYFASNRAENLIKRQNASQN